MTNVGQTEPGDRVRIFGLNGRTDLNGRCGTALRYVDVYTGLATRRWAVEVEGTGERVKVQELNLWFYDLSMVRKASERAHISVEALILLLDRVPHDDIKDLHEACYTEDTELVAMQAWVIDLQEELEEIQELVKWLATGGMYDALAMNFGADLAGKIRRHAAQRNPRTGPLVLSDLMHT